MNDLRAMIQLLTTATSTIQNPNSVRNLMERCTRIEFSIGYQTNVRCQIRTRILESSLIKIGLDNMGRVPRIKFICDNPDCPLPNKTFTENITGALRRKKNKYNYCSNRCKNADKSRTNIKSTEKRN